MAVPQCSPPPVGERNQTPLPRLALRFRMTECPPPSVPLCVDLDGTLCRSDTLLEALVQGLRERPWMLFAALLAVLSGRARFKAWVADTFGLEPGSLPLREDLVQWLHDQRALGRQLVLATAASRKSADIVAASLGIFDEVLASTPETNLRGAAKAEALVARFGERGFLYAGNDRHDLDVWRRAAGAVVVDASPGLLAHITCPIVRLFPRERPRAVELLRALRPHQWAKNALVFVPLLASGRWSDAPAIRGSSLAFFALSAMASAVYLVNDLIDLASDRRHRSKRRRPLAQASLPIAWAVPAACVLSAAAMTIAFAGGTGLFLALASYVVLTTAYTLLLKRVALVDVFVLSALYTLRMYAGGMAAGIPISIWLLNFGMFLFLSLALLKRLVEIGRQTDAGSVPGRGYSTHDATPILALGCASGIVASLVLALYVNSEAARSQYHLVEPLFGLVPLCLFVVCRLWLSGWRGQLDDDPVAGSLRDPGFWAAGILGVLLVFLGRR